MFSNHLIYFSSTMQTALHYQCTAEKLNYFAVSFLSFYFALNTHENTTSMSALRMNRQNGQDHNGALTNEVKHLIFEYLEAEVQQYLPMQHRSLGTFLYRYKSQYVRKKSFEKNGNFYN